MSESSDDVQLSVKDEIVPPAAEDVPSDADDVEVVAQAPEAEAETQPPVARHDSVMPPRASSRRRRNRSVTRTILVRSRRRPVTC